MMLHQCTNFVRVGIVAHHIAQTDDGIDLRKVFEHGDESRKICMNVRQQCDSHEFHQCGVSTPDCTQAMYSASPSSREILGRYFSPDAARVRSTSQRHPSSGSDTPLALTSLWVPGVNRATVRASSCMLVVSLPPML